MSPAEWVGLHSSRGQLWLTQRGAFLSHRPDTQMATDGGGGWVVGDVATRPWRPDGRCIEWWGAKAPGPQTVSPTTLSPPSAAASYQSPPRCDSKATSRPRPR